MMSFSGAASQGVLPLLNQDLQALFVLIYLVSLCATCLTTILVVYYNDAGLAVTGWSLLLVIWGFVLIWLFYGNVFALLSGMLTGQTSPIVQWQLNNLVCVSWCLVPIGLVGFVYHTLRLVANELKRSSRLPS